MICSCTANISSKEAIMEKIEKQQLLEAVSNIKIWKQGDKRAPHKPLLLLLTLSRLQHGKERLVLFSDIEKPLTELLIEFGPWRKSNHPEQPFFRLPSDGIWELLDNQGGIPIINRKFTKTSLRKEKIKGGFTQIVFDLINADSELLEQLSNILLEANFPSTIHQDILDAVGLDIEINHQGKISQEKRRKRDPAFRGKILQAYNYRCAICGFDVRLGNTPIALEAAHIMWHQAGGPDIENNGLALCSLHHKLLDRGALAISNEFRIIISEKANGYIGFKEWLLDFDGKKLNMPQKEAYIPSIGFTEWHVREVFQGYY